MSVTESKPSGTSDIKQYTKKPNIGDPDYIRSVHFADGYAFSFTNIQLSSMKYFDDIPYSRIELQRSSIGFELLHYFATTGEMNVMNTKYIKYFEIIFAQAVYFKYDKLIKFLSTTEIPWTMKIKSKKCVCSLSYENCHAHICVCDSFQKCDHPNTVHNCMCLSIFIDSSLPRDSKKGINLVCKSIGHNCICIETIKSKTPVCKSIEHECICL